MKLLLLFGLMSVAWAGLVRPETEEESATGRTLDSLTRVDLVGAATNLVNQVMDGLNITPPSSYLFTETLTVHTVVKARATKRITCAKYISSDDCVRSDDDPTTTDTPTSVPTTTDTPTSVPTTTDTPTSVPTTTDTPTSVPTTTETTIATTGLPVNRADNINATNTIAGITSTTLLAFTEDTTDKPSTIILASQDELESARASDVETPALDDGITTTQGSVEEAEARAAGPPGLVTMVTHTYTSTIFTSTISSVISSLTISYLGCSAPSVSSGFPACKLTKSTTVAELFVETRSIS